jgi:hypothetical protein
MRCLFNENLKLFISFEKIKTRMKRDLTLMNDIISFTTTMKRIYVVLTSDVRLNNVNTLNQKTKIDKIIKQNNTLHKNLIILRVTWTKKITNQRKKFFSLNIWDRQLEDDELLDKRKVIKWTHAFNLRIFWKELLYKIMF